VRSVAAAHVVRYVLSREEGGGLTLPVDPG
jgi:hypothetical protein